ncbi:MAG: helix-hairpin-helix domain-containing protein [Pseudomonadota bacterium]
MLRAVFAVVAVVFLLLAGSTDAEEVPQLLDINTSSAADLMMLKGIGPKTAEKILKHRDGLGGFTSLHQLTDVKGIGEKTYQRIACVFMVPKEGPQPCVSGAGGASKGPRVNINLADAATLTALSGIGLKKAEAIVRHRAGNGWFSAAEDLQAVKGIGSKTILGFAAQVEVFVDVNRATVAELRSLGFENAAAMVKVRDAVGGFATLDDLYAVPDTDKQRVKRARHILTFGARDGQ